MPHDMFYTLWTRDIPAEHCLDVILRVDIVADHQKKRPARQLLCKVYKSHQAGVGGKHCLPIETLQVFVNKISGCWDRECLIWIVHYQEVPTTCIDAVSRAAQAIILPSNQYTEPQICTTCVQTGANNGSICGRLHTRCKLSSGRSDTSCTSIGIFGRHLHS